MEVVIVFLLAVLFVVAVWGREAGQKLFKGGMKVAGVLFAIAAFIIILLAINIKPPSNASVQESVQSLQRSPYYVPLNNSQTTHNFSAPAPQRIEPAETTANSTTTALPISAPANASLPIRSGKPHFGFGYVPRNGFVVVTNVYPGSPADQAGMKPGMAILAVDGATVAGIDDVWQAQHRRHQIGDNVLFVIGDGAGARWNISVRLASDAEPWGATVNR